jgi:hypothetical protein
MPKNLRCAPSCEEDLKVANYRANVVYQRLSAESPTGAGVPARTLLQWISRFCATESQAVAGYIGLLPRTGHHGNPTCHLSDRPLQLMGKRCSARIATLSATASPQISRAYMPAKRTYHSRGESLRTTASETAVPKARYGGRREAEYPSRHTLSSNKASLHTDPRPSVLHALTPCDWDTVRRGLMLCDQIGGSRCRLRVAADTPNPR